MEMEERAAAIAAVREYIRIFKISFKKKSRSEDVLSSKKENLWGKSGRKLLMKNRSLMQMKAFPCKIRKYSFTGDPSGIYKK
ncbi:MAG: hypothetical protein H6680_07540 [Desulfobacteraceae bacterium]|nr:hypothetical protein [Desulfobacteraceae bacterium]